MQVILNVNYGPRLNNEFKEFKSVNSRERVIAAMEIDLIDKDKRIFRDKWETRQLLARVSPGDGHILSSSNSITSAV